MCIYFWERGRKSMSRGGVERGRHRIGSRLPALSHQPRVRRLCHAALPCRLWAMQPRVLHQRGRKLTDCEIVTWAEVGRLTDWATQASQYCYVTFKGGSLDESTVNANCFQETISERIWLFMSLARMIWVWLTVSILLSWWKHLLTLYSLQGCLAKRKPTLLHHERMLTDRQLAYTLNEINPAIISFFLPSV